MTTAEFEAAVASIPFQGTRHHAWLIYGLIRQRRPGVVLETGTYAGYVTAHIGRALNENHEHCGVVGCCFSIDDYSYGAVTREQVRQNLNRAGAGMGVNLVAGRSLECPWPGGIDLAVLDGDRSLPGFAEEVRRVVARGATCFVVHDTHHDKDACHYAREFARHMTDWETINVHLDGGLLLAVKRERGGICTESDGSNPRVCDLTDYVVESSPEFALPNGVIIPQIGTGESPHG